MNLVTVCFYQLKYYLIIANLGAETDDDRRTAFMYLCHWSGSKPFLHFYVHLHFELLSMLLLNRAGLCKIILDFPDPR